MVRSRTATGPRNGKARHNGKRQPRRVEWSFDGSEQSRNAIAAENVGLCYYMAGKLLHHAPPDMEAGDLAMAGVPGLLRAVELFDPGRGVQFSTYACRAIRQHITRAILTWRELPAKPIGEPADWARRTATDPEIIDATTAGHETDPADAAEVADLLAALADECTPREWYVLTRRSRGAILQRVGAEIGLTKERVRQIQARALGRLRTYLDATTVA